MARILLDIDDPANRFTLKALLESERHEVVTTAPDAIIADSPLKALHHAKERPTLLLANASEIRDAVRAMRQGVYGYIFVPFQPGEAALMVDRALQSRPSEPGTAQPHHSPAGDTPATLEDAETRLILDTLKQCKFNKAETARRLGIGRNTLWRKLHHIHHEKR